MARRLASAFILCALCAACLLAGCWRRDPGEHYATRGLVRADEGRGADRRLAIHHEAIPTFKDREGATAPMPSMTMVFGLTRELRGVSLRPGSKLALEFDVRWEERPLLVITKLSQLPDDTQLTLSTAH